MIDAAAVVTEARSWVGVPFRHQGRSRSGIDCVGLPICILKALEALPDDLTVPAYPRFPNKNEVLGGLTAHCSRITAPVPGALLAFRWSRTLAHVALYTDTDTVIHADERRKCVIEHGCRGIWRGRFLDSVWALPGVTYGA